MTSAASPAGISFTPRVFPTPMRESKAAEEEDWVAKNRKHLKRHGVLGKNNQGGSKGESTIVPVSDVVSCWSIFKVDQW